MLPAPFTSKKLVTIDSFQLYMVHHLFNSTEFTKQDFLLTVNNEDFNNIATTYGNIVFVYKLELRVSQALLGVF